MVEHSSSTETPHHEPRLSRQLGLTTATALVVAEVIGVGIFLTTAGMVKSLGSPFWLLPVWLTTGVAAAGGAICFGALAARRPEAGGAYVYLWVAQLPFLTLLLLPALFPRLFPNVPRPGPDDDLGAVPGRARRLGRGGVPRHPAGEVRPVPSATASRPTPTRSLTRSAWRPARRSARSPRAGAGSRCP